MPRHRSTAGCTSTTDRRWRRGVGALRLCIALAAPAAAAVTPAAAAAWRPTDPGEVLERLPKPAAGGGQALARERAAAAAATDDPAPALALARRYLEMGRNDADPRWDGHAEAVLDPWWRRDDAPAEAFVLRAVIHQRSHRFADALADLDRVLVDHPGHGEAWLVRATVLMASGRAAEAAQACQRLQRTASYAATVCLARARALSGDGARAYRRLAAAVDRTGVPAAERQWAETVLGEIARGQGDVVAAERHFRAAIAAGRSVLALAALADLLLATGRPQAVHQLLAGEEAVDPLLLRLAIASVRLDHPDRDRQRRLLADRFAAARLRGDAARHLREEAMSALDVDAQPAVALDLALANWQRQREPADARLLLAAALAAGRPAAADGVRTWIAASGLADAEAAALIARLSTAGNGS